MTAAASAAAPTSRREKPPEPRSVSAVVAYVKRRNFLLVKRIVSNWEIARLWQYIYDLSP